MGAKRSIFKKPAWASTTTSTTKEDTPIFGQAHLYQDILEDQKARREKHAARQKERAEKDKQQQEERESKRRRISNEAEDSDYGSDSDAKSIRSGSADSQASQKSSTPVESEQPKLTESSPQKQKCRLVDQLDVAPPPQTRSQKRRLPVQDEAIILEDDSSVEELTHAQGGSKFQSKNLSSNSKPKSKQPIPEPESEEEDEYLQELKAKARREAQAKGTNAKASKENISASPPKHHPSYIKSPTSGRSVSPLAHASSRSSRATSTPLNDDEAEVKIWIKTIIPGAKEVIVNRKISQPLDKVKEFWIKRNELDPAIAEKVFFTWNSTRLYNSTTMRGIIERLKKTHPTTDGSDPSNGKIMIEAVTEEIFQYRQEQRARRLAEAEGKTTGADQADGEEGGSAGEDEDVAVQQPQKPCIVIKLKAEGRDEMSIRVYDDTTIGKILSGYRKLQRIDPGIQGWLSYDGDRLDDESTVKEVGFEHDDTIEVYLR